MPPIPKRKFRLHNLDCLEFMETCKPNSIDSIVTDPPYGLKFMGKGWDHGIPGKEYWKAALRIAKPGAILLTFGGTRTYHRLACAIEDAGWELRDCIMWIYSQGFPKGHNMAWELHKTACITCGRMVEYAHGDEQEAGIVSEAEHTMRFVRGTYLQTAVYACEKCGQVLQPFLSEQEASELRTAWLQSKTSWPEQSSLEGGRDLEACEGKLQRCQVCQMSHGILADGAEGWVHHGTSSHNGTVPWQVPNSDGSCPSYRSQSVEQLSSQPDAFRIERRAQAFRGWNVCLKPAYEPILLAMKPLDGTYAANAIKHGVAGINVDGCRVGTDVVSTHSRGKNGAFPKRPGETSPEESGRVQDQREGLDYSTRQGRWPANLIHDGSDEVLELFPLSKDGKAVGRNASAGNVYGGGRGLISREKGKDSLGYGGKGSAARFFKCCPQDDYSVSRLKYCAKASKKERGEGNSHPTVKPLALVEYLCKLTATPTGGVVFDPFMGSGTTGVACANVGREFVGCENDTEHGYFKIALKRVKEAYATTPKKQRSKSTR